MFSIMNNFTPLVHALKFLAIPILMGIAVVIIISLISIRFSKQPSRPEHKPLIVAFCFLGVILGAIAGGSSTPVGEALVTGVLGIITALLTFLLSKDSIQTWRVFIPYAMVALLMSAFLGLVVGANYKVINRTLIAKNNRGEQLWDKYYEKILIPMCLQEKEKMLDGWKVPSGYLTHCEIIKVQLKR